MADSFSMNSTLVNRTSSMPVQVMKLTRSVSVTVRPTVLNLRPTGSSSQGNPRPTVSMSSIALSLVPSDRRAGRYQPIDLGRAESSFLQNRARMRTILRRRLRLALRTRGNEDRAVDRLDGAVAWIVALHDRVAIAHLRIVHRFLQRRERRPFDVVDAELLAPVTQGLRLEL